MQLIVGNFSGTTSLPAVGALTPTPLSASRRGQVEHAPARRRSWDTQARIFGHQTAQTCGNQIVAHPSGPRS